MFTATTPKRTHELAENDVLLWEGHYYLVKSVTPNGPSMSELVLSPVSPALFEFRTTLRSDMLVMTHTWK